MKRLLPVIIVIVLLFSACGAPAEKEVEQTQAPVAPSAEPTKAPTPSEYVRDTAGIPGSHYIDIVMSLEEQGVPKGEYKKSADPDSNTHYCSSTSAEANSGDIYDYYLSINNKDEIIYANFTISYGGLTTPEVFAQSAADYIGYCATIPYDTADSATARTWIIENIPSVTNTGTADKAGEVSTTIGDAVFTLYGNKIDNYYGVFWLDITLRK